MTTTFSVLLNKRGLILASHLYLLLVNLIIKFPEVQCKQLIDGRPLLFRSDASSNYRLNLLIVNVL
jgi:hypothetical protein